jgi:hypothetical protein
MLLRYEGDYAGAEAALHECLTCRRAMGDRQGAAFALWLLGHLARSMGQDELAGERYDECMELSQELGYRYGVASTHHNRAYLALRRGDVPAAAAYLAECLSIAREIDDRDLLGRVPAVLGGVAAARGRPALAARLVGASDAWFGLIGRTIDATERAEHDGYLQAARAQIGEAACAAAYAEGAALSVEQALEQLAGQLL